MYERSAIVLERYFNNLFLFNKKPNLKTSYRNLKEMINEVDRYQQIIAKEDEIITDFDGAANRIKEIQQEQQKINRYNIKAENARNQLFDILAEQPEIIEKKLKKIEENLEKNYERQKTLRENYINELVLFNQRQKDRNRCSKARRNEEGIYLQLIKKVEKDLNDIDLELIKFLKYFINKSGDFEEKELEEIMVNNGKNEKVPFSLKVIENAIIARSEIAKKEAQCYLSIYDKNKKIISDAVNDNVNLDKYKRIMDHTSAKLAFLKAVKMYIISFLDYERLTIMSGPTIHEKLMTDACNKFEQDIEQINNLYELLLKEMNGKATKKLYSDLYNKQYLLHIQNKERSFEKEVDGININAGTIINSNYWRINEIANIYKIFEEEVTTKFGRDLFEFTPNEEIFEVEEIGDEIEMPVIEDYEGNVDINLQQLEEASKDEKDDDIVEYIDDFDDTDIDESAIDLDELEDKEVEIEEEEEEDYSDLFEDEQEDLDKITYINSLIEGEEDTDYLDMNYYEPEEQKEAADDFINHSDEEQNYDDYIFKNYYDYNSKEDDDIDWSVSKRTDEEDDNFYKRFL